MERVTGDWVEKTLRRPSIRSAEAEDGRCGHGVPDTGFWNPTPGRPRELAVLPLPIYILKRRAWFKIHDGVTTRNFRLILGLGNASNA